MYRLLLLCLLLPFAVLADSPLRDHPSPYLAMHADDPINWQQWDGGIFEQARRENKLIFVSSGYFACHWCHVMQRESYQNPAIAALLNEHFIAIKLDRELRPDLDTYLFDFTQRTHGIAGWPLNVFLTPEGQALLGMVYQPADDFLQIIETLQQAWQDDATGLSELAHQSSLPETDDPAPTDDVARHALRSEFEQAWITAIGQRGDFLSGGFGEASKFPQVPLLTLMLEHYHLHSELGELLRLSLEQMANLGLRDHLGGGFFRYTVDPDWREPHFEKMLYDNAQLARLYLLAADRLDIPHYREVAKQTLDFMLRQMWHPQGGFIGSLSAIDQDDVEGGYYLWHLDDLDQLLNEAELALLQDAWGLSASPIWDAGYLPLALHDIASLATRHHTTEAHIAAQLRSIRQTLMRERRQREMTYDDKRLAGWNGLALSALALARNLQPRYHIAAHAVRDYLHGLWDGEQLWMMREHQGALRQPAGLEDYAFVARGLYHWHQASGDPASRDLSNRLLHAASQRFHQHGRWKLGAADSARLGQTYALISSGPLPSPAMELLHLQRLMDESSLPEENLLWAAPSQLLDNPLDYPDYLNLMLTLKNP